MKGLLTGLLAFGIMLAGGVAIQLAPGPHVFRPPAVHAQAHHHGRDKTADARAHAARQQAAATPPAKARAALRPHARILGWLLRLARWHRYRPWWRRYGRR